MLSLFTYSLTLAFYNVIIVHCYSQTSSYFFYICSNLYFLHFKHETFVFPEGNHRVDSKDVFFWILHFLVSLARDHVSGGKFHLFSFL